MRRCGRCNLLKPLEDFAWRRIERGQRDNMCRPCRADYKKEHYRKNKAAYVRNASARRDRIYNQRIEWLISYLAEHPCVDCGINDPVVLEFDHLRDKVFSISEGIRNRPWSDVLAEVEKCEVVCANCHRRRTARRIASRRYTAAAADPKASD